MVRVSFWRFVILASISVSANAEEWLSFQYGNDDGVSYETSLIEKSGFFSKDVSVWLRATYSINENECGAAPTAPNISHNADFASLASRAFAMQSAQRDYSICMQNLSRKNKVAIYKLTFNCDDKSIMAVPTTVTNYLGESVGSQFHVKDHPGSLGYEVIKHYCM